MRSLSIDHRDAQLGRLRELGRSSALPAPSGICDSLVAQPDGTALCTGHADGPLGSDVPMRMTLAAPGGAQQRPLPFVVFNTKSLEAKAPIFGWTELVRPHGLELSLDLTPGTDRWTATTRSGVTMTSTRTRRSAWGSSSGSSTTGSPPTSRAADSVSVARALDLRGFAPSRRAHGIASVSPRGAIRIFR